MTDPPHTLLKDAFHLLETSLGSLVWQPIPLSCEEGVLEESEGSFPFERGDISELH